MAHTFHQLLYHLVWSTKERLPLIIPGLQERLYDYLGGTFRNLHCHPIEIGGMPDHMHVLVAIPPNVSVSEIMRSVKVSSSKWVSQTFPHQRGFSWQNGYGAFSVSPLQRGAVINYIQNQEAHHKELSFREEFLKILKRHNIQFDEKYLWR